MTPVLLAAIPRLGPCAGTTLPGQRPFFSSQCCRRAGLRHTLCQPAPGDGPPAAVPSPAPGRDRLVLVTPARPARPLGAQGCSKRAAQSGAALSPEYLATEPYAHGQGRKEPTLHQQGDRQAVEKPRQHCCPHDSHVAPGATDTLTEPCSGPLQEPVSQDSDASSVAPTRQPLVARANRTNAPRRIRERCGPIALQRRSIAWAPALRPSCPFRRLFIQLDKP